MSFDRYRAQTSCEAFLGCATLDDWNNADFKNFILSKSNAHVFNNALKEDACDLYYKGLISLLESIKGLTNRQYSWAIVKGYYSVFYMLRADLALKEVGLIRQGGIYYLEAKEGAKPEKKNNHKKYGTDHKATINYFLLLLGNTDILASQNIEGVNSYEWLMKKREQINYRERVFNEPTAPLFLSFIDSEVSNGNLKNLISAIVNDPYIKTFQKEYAPIAIPIKRAILTRQSFNNSGIALNIQEDKLNYAKSLAIYKIDALFQH